MISRKSKYVPLTWRQATTFFIFLSTQGSVFRFPSSVSKVSTLSRRNMIPLASSRRISSLSAGRPFLWCGEVIIAKLLGEISTPNYLLRTCVARVSFFWGLSCPCEPWEMPLFLRKWTQTHPDDLCGFLKIRRFLVASGLKLAWCAQIFGGSTVYTKSAEVSVLSYFSREKCGGYPKRKTTSCQIGGTWPTTWGDQLRRVMQTRAGLPFFATPLKNPLVFLLHPMRCSCQRSLCEVGPQP